jgi:hypothetical protein
MEWIGSLLGFIAGLAILGIFALQELHAVAEYAEPRMNTDEHR